jgi:cell division protein FtsI (penicillin-binding protein 3)
MALAFPPEHMWSFYVRLGFGSSLGLGFKGEASGKLHPAKNWKPVEQATMAFGYGVSATLAQVAHAYLAIARDGDLLPLSLTRVDIPPSSGTPVFSPQVAREVRKMMETVVNPGGTATRAQVSGYRVAGKTGTANKNEKGRYVDKYVSSFVGLAPVSNPKLVVAVMIDEPSIEHFGGTVAAPIFAQVAEGALRALGVTPDAPLAPLQLTTAAEHRERGRREGNM